MIFEAPLASYRNDLGRQAAMALHDSLSRKATSEVSRRQAQVP
jgi:hypothetical protein